MLFFKIREMEEKHALHQTEGSSALKREEREEAVARLGDSRDYIEQYAFTFTLLLNWGTVITMCSALPSTSCLGSSALPQERTGVRNVRCPQVFFRGIALRYTAAIRYLLHLSVTKHPATTEIYTLLPGVNVYM